MIRKATERKGIRKIVRSFRRRYDNYYSDLSYTFDWFLKDDHLTHIFIYEENDRIVDFISTYTIDGQTIIYPYFLDDNKIKKEMSEIIQYWGNVIVEVSAFCVEFDELHKCSFQSTVDLDMQYCKPSNSSTFYTNDENLVDFFVNICEKAYFPKFNGIENLEFRYVDTYEGIISLITKDPLEDGMFPLWFNKYNNYSIAGFTYFKPESNENSMYLVALNNECIAGLIKLGRYGEKADKRQSVCYIDVNKAYWNRGVAKAMISKLGAYLDSELPLVLTDESELGAKCRMLEHFKNAGYEVPVYGYREFYEHLYQ